MPRVGRARRPRIPDLRGQRFGAFTVVRDSQAEDGLYRRLVACVCDCGRDYMVQAGALVKGTLKACGRTGCKEARRRIEVA